MIDLSKSEIDDLRDLNELCNRLSADLVIVGAIAYQIHFDDDELTTSDIDFAIALDLDDFAKQWDELSAMGWTQDAKREERWRSKAGALLDLIPAGKGLRDSKRFTWPKGQTTMSLVGFDHAFADARPETIADDLALPVIPPVVLMLLKIIALMDDTTRRVKDLAHIRALVSRYEADGDRIISDAIINGRIEYDLANAFLLGRDLRALCTDEEAELVRGFIVLVGNEDKADWWAFVRAGRQSRDREEEIAREQLRTFASAFSAG